MQTACAHTRTLTPTGVACTSLPACAARRGSRCGSRPGSRGCAGGTPRRTADARHTRRSAPTTPSAGRTHQPISFERDQRLRQTNRSSGAANQSIGGRDKPLDQRSRQTNRSAVETNHSIGGRDKPLDQRSRQTNRSAVAAN